MGGAKVEHRMREDQGVKRGFPEKKFQNHISYIRLVVHSEIRYDC